MHFGVYTPSALPITSYSASPNDNYRTVINVDRFDPVEVETIEQVLHEGSPGTWSPNEVSCDPGFFACGAEVQYNSYSPELQDIFTDEWKIQGLRFKCCGGADPADQTTKLVYEENEGRGAHGSSNYVSVLIQCCCPLSFYVSWFASHTLILCRRNGVALRIVQKASISMAAK